MAEEAGSVEQAGPVPASEVLVSASRLPSREQLVDLYDSVGWAAYTTDPDGLAQGVANSLRVVTAWEADDSLIGLARIVGDGHTIAYLQDVLVRPQWQRSGIGRLLMQEAFAPYTNVRQQLLLTDDDPAQKAFYEALGFQEIRGVQDADLRAFIRFGRG